MNNSRNGVHTFPIVISLKVNIMTGLEFELAYNNFTVERNNKYTTGSL